jgi:hypothetical protein
MLSDVIHDNIIQIIKELQEYNYVNEKDFKYTKKFKYILKMLLVMFNTVKYLDWGEKPELNTYKNYIIDLWDEMIREKINENTLYLSD